MKIATWIDRLAGIVMALSIAHVLGADALGEWTLLLLIVWILSPWPEGTLTTRLGAGVLGLAGVGVVSWFWQGNVDRQALLWTLAFGMLGIRVVHALPASWQWRTLAAALSFLAGLVTLGITKSLLATNTALASTACFAALIGCLRYHAQLGSFKPVDWTVWAGSLLTALLQSQSILWVYALGLSTRAVGELAAAFFVLEFCKGALALLALKFDHALIRFAKVRESFLETVRSLTVYCMLVMPPLVLIVFFLAGPLINHLLGPSFADTVALLRLLIWGFAFSFLSLMGTRVLGAQHKHVVWARVSAGAVEASLDWLWIPLMGLEGACYARVIGEALAFVIIAYQVCRTVPDLINPFRKTYG